MNRRKFTLTFATPTGFHSVWLETDSKISRELIERAAKEAGLDPDKAAVVFCMELES